MATNRYQTIVQGEASETDSEEEEFYISSGPPVSFSGAAGVKVEGEASETDSEKEEERESAEISLDSGAVNMQLPPLIVIRNEQQSSPSAMEEKPALQIKHSGRYSTLLQQKLLESNARLHHDVSGTVKQVYQNATKEIRTATAHLSNSQSGIINASYTIRQILEDLRAVSEKIDIITSCDLLPDIRMPSTQ
ncbi:biogenesis of lysosome-related organelles complex 1 subunit 3 isoform X2 [Protopterus annectens]|nr:biogenesis of lysosome-related organelles complex 1 subunit 3 isoform X2 [Protopterus annectens]